jgi:intein/homing endonuclease/multimeric flavodoxin WrbA
MIIRKLGQRPKVVLFQGSPRDKETCPNMNSKTHKVLEYLTDKWSPFIDFVVIDLAVNPKKRPTIQPCKGCVSTAGGYHCVAEGERVETISGFKRIEELKQGDVLSTGIVERVWRSGENQKIYQITTTDGRKIRLTDNHPIKILEPIYKNNNKRKLICNKEKWIEVKDLKIGDRVPFVLNKFIDTEIKNNGIDNKIYLIAGMVWGDGCYKHNKLKICYDIKDYKLFNYINENFEINISKGVKTENTQVDWISFTDKKINDYLEKILDGEKRKDIHERRISDIIMNSKKEQIASFLNGWFSTDGSIIKRNSSDYYEINLTSVSLDSLRDAQLLLSKFGIKSSISYLDHIKTFRFNKMIKRSSMLVISGKNANIFMDEIGIINKEDKFEKINYKNSKKKGYFGKIKKIEFVGYSDVYDISVSKSHKFICEGFEVHNCHWQCDCFIKGSKVAPDLLKELDVYDHLEQSDAFVILSPIHWHSLTSQIKLLFDRLVCANLTLTHDDAIKLMGEGNIKNSDITGKFAKSAKHTDMLRNHLEGKVCAFYVHGDAGADEYKNGDFPEAYDVLDDGFTNNAKNVVMPYVMQMKYSGIFVPDELIEAFYVNKGLDYYTANFTKEWELYERADNLMDNLLNFLEKKKNSNEN